MDKDTKRFRITGSIFLLAILVIVLPMLFDGDGLPTVEIEAIPEIARDSMIELPPVAAPPVQAAPPLLAENPYVEKIAELESSVDEDLFSTEHGTQVGEPVLSRPDSDTERWAVQVGSFSSEERALALRQDLRDAGYDAFISAVKKDGKVMIRVAVGPYLDGSEAETIRRKLAGGQAPDARVMAFST